MLTGRLLGLEVWIENNPKDFTRGALDISQNDPRHHQNMDLCPRSCSTMLLTRSNAEQDKSAIAVLDS